MTAYMDHKDLSNTSISAERTREIQDGVHTTLDRVAQAAAKSGRTFEDVTVLAATKTRDVAEIQTAIESGITLIGENRPQEILAKAAGLTQWRLQHKPAVAQHIIGQLQSNKISKILPYVDVIESVDSLKLAQRISRRATSLDNELGGKHEIGVYLEVNVSGEESKSGCNPDEAFDLACEVATLEGLQLQGLMTIGAHVDNEATIRAGFTNLRQLRDDLIAKGGEHTQLCTQLSMGMSSDLEFAIAEGATIVRVGTSIFGERAFI